MKSEIIFVSLFSRSESEIEIPQKIKFQKNLENSRETRLSLVTEAGTCAKTVKTVFEPFSPLHGPKTYP